MNTSNFLVLLKTDDIYMDIAEEAETRCDSKPGIMNWTDHSGKERA